MTPCLKMHLSCPQSMVGEKIGIYSSPLAKNKCPLIFHHGWRKNFTHLNWLKMHLNYPPSMVGGNFGIHTQCLLSFRSLSNESNLFLKMFETKLYQRSETPAPILSSGGGVTFTSYKTIWH